MNQSGKPEPEPTVGAQRTDTRQTLHRTARVLRSVAQSARKLGNRERAAQLEDLADEALERAERVRGRERRRAAAVRAGVLLVDDHELAREALRSLLAREQAFLVIGEASDGEAAVRLARQLRPHLVLMDVRMPGLDGLAATRVIAAELPETRVIVLTSFEDRALVLEALRAGAVGYVLKGASKQEVLDTLHAGLRGEARVQGSLAAELLRDDIRGNVTPGLQSLSLRELEVVRLMAAGQTNAQIARTLQVSVNTAKTHVLRILRKLDAPDRAAAVARAAALGLLADTYEVAR